MQYIGEYAQLIKLILGESGKYFLLLLSSVLAIRLWRRLSKMSGKNRRQNLLLACLASAAAWGIGYCSIYHSLSLVYSAYGMRAFSDGNLTSAVSLFQTSSEYWKSTDTLGKEGVCLLFLGKTDRGMQFLDAAKALRKGKNTPFEQFYKGLFYFLSEQSDKAIPLLEAASVDTTYRWQVTKILAVIQIDKNNAADAARLLNPFLQVEVKECDHAYIMASLKLLAGKNAEAQALLDKFPSASLPSFWKSRFEKLRAKTQN
jgi:hypothetical protein